MGTAAVLSMNMHAGRAPGWRDSVTGKRRFKFKAGGGIYLFTLSALPFQLRNFAVFRFQKPRRMQLKSVKCGATEPCFSLAASKDSRPTVEIPNTFSPGDQ